MCVWGVIQLIKVGNTIDLARSLVSLVAGSKEIEGVSTRLDIL